VHARRACGHWFAQVKLDAALESPCPL
jgi:hypothetical protein